MATETKQDRGEIKGEQVADAKRTCFFEIEKGPDKKINWILWSGNGRPMAMSAISYDRANDALHAIQTILSQVHRNTRIVIAHSGE